jgi:hypothetical protein
MVKCFARFFAFLQVAFVASSASIFARQMVVVSYTVLSECFMGLRSLRPLGLELLLQLAQRLEGLLERRGRVAASDL